MNFFIEQIAIFPPDHAAAKAFLEKLGARFIEDEVQAVGRVRDNSATHNVGRLSFDYDLAPDGVELEVLSYKSGDHWMQPHAPSVSHLGMHCSEKELDQWKQWFSNEGIGIVQEVWTMLHTNPYLLQKRRRYHYCIFGTRAILGVDLKFIVRVEHAEDDGD